jgi:hypothetical protein
MENANTNNSDGAASSIINEPTSNNRDEIGTEDDSAPVPEQITSDDEEPVPLVQQVAAIPHKKLLAHVSNTNIAEAVDDVLDGANEASDVALDAGDVPLCTLNRQDTMGTEPTAALTLPSSDGATNYESPGGIERTTALTARCSDITSENPTHLIEAYLVEDDELPVYDATPELPWWKQRRFRIMVLLICILILLVAVLLAVFLGGDTSSSISLETTSSLSRSSYPVSTPKPTLNPHTSPKVSLIVVLNGVAAL